MFNSSIKAPVEAIIHSSKSSQRFLEKELKNAMKSLHKIHSEIKSGSKTLNDNSTQKEIESIESHLLNLKQKLSESKEFEKHCIDQLKKRIEFSQIVEHDNTNDVSNSSLTEISNTTNDIATTEILNRLLIDFTLRNGHIKTANLLSNQLDQKLLHDFELHERNFEIVAALRAQSCKPALKWCAENRPRLKKHEIDLEFQLRKQEFIEYIRRGDTEKALQYARAAFPLFDNKLDEIKQAMACLAFGADTTHPRYASLFAAARYDELASAFVSAAAVVSGVARLPRLTAYAVAALATLKTHACTQVVDRNVNCPACAESLWHLAAALPIATRQQSCIVCRITGQVMSASNPPLALPNGNVYSTEGLASIVDRNGNVRDPRSGEVFALDQATKVYVL